MAADSAPPPLWIELLRRADGGAVLRCTRADGTVTWQRQAGASAGFFPRHDLTHYAVESVLRSRLGFYGLIASGWDIADTEGKGRRGRLPAETIAVEHIVGLLDVERATGSDWSAAEFSEQSRTFAAERGYPPPAGLTGQELHRIREMRAELLARWASLLPGETLELRFAVDTG